MTGWPQVRAGEVLQLVRELVDTEPTREYTQIGIRSFGKGLFRYAPTFPAGLGKLRYFSFPSNALAISNIKAWEGAITVSPEESKSLVASNRFLFYVPRDHAEVEVTFVRAFLLSDIGLRRVGQASPGSADRNRTLSQAGFDRLMIPLPPLDEQRRIATRIQAYGSTVDSIAASNTVSYSLARAFYTSALASWQSRWCTETLHIGDDIAIRSGGTPDTSNAALWDGPHPWVTPADLGRGRGEQEITGGARSLTDEGLARLGKRMVPSGAVVMSSRAPIGYLAIASRPLTTNQGCKSFVGPTGLDPRLLLWSFRAIMPDILSASSGSTFQEVSTKRLSGLKVRVPTTSGQKRALTEIEQIGDRIKLIEHVRARSTKMIKSATAALLNEVFSGRL